MTQPLHHNSAERIGRRLGRLWQSLTQLQARCRHALVQAGLSTLAANCLIAAIWLFVAAAVLYYSLWIVIVAACVIGLLIAGVSDLPNSVDCEYKWRNGFMGFGLYNEDGLRVDLHDPEKKID